MVTHRARVDGSMPASNTGGTNALGTMPARRASRTKRSRAAASGAMSGDHTDSATGSAPRRARYTARVLWAARSPSTTRLPAKVDPGARGGGGRIAGQANLNVRGAQRPTAGALAEPQGLDEQGAQHVNVARRQRCEHTQ